MGESIMKIWQWGMAIAIGIWTLAGYAQDYPWGRIGAEQIGRAHV